MESLHLKEHHLPGRLITFCGLDGCGKTTMISCLKSYLEARGDTVLLTRQPSDFIRKSKIFRSVQDTPDHIGYDYRAMSLMAAADRLQHCHEIILPALEAGKTVISDRYIYSCLANLRVRGYQRDQWIYEIVLQIPKPDACFFLDVPVKTALSRVRARPDEKYKYVDLKLQQLLRREYLSIAKENDGRVIDSSTSLQFTFEQILRALDLGMEGEEAAGFGISAAHA